MRIQLYLKSFIFLTCLSTWQDAVAKEPLNIARRAEHSYLEPAANREGHRYTEETVNEYRVYDFYQRQADYYMAQDKRPSLIPSFPGLDAGEHGHWGKHSQNQHEDGRWNDIDLGSMVCHTINAGKGAYGKGVAVNLGAGVSVCFDTESFSYPLVWQGGFVKFHPYRWGTSRLANVDGELWWEATGAKSGETSEVSLLGGEMKYHGLYRHGESVIFSYSIQGQQVLTSAERSGVGEKTAVFFHYTFPDGYRGGTIHLPKELKASNLTVSEGLVIEKQVVQVPPQKSGASVFVRIGKSSSIVSSLEGSKKGLSSLVGGGPAQWTETVKTEVAMGTEKDLAYVIDTIRLPEDTGFQSMLQLTSVGFLPNGDALVVSLAGEVYRVSGLGNGSKEVEWKRYASGLHQPIGIHIDKDGIFVLERGQITRLHDLNSDGEVDFHENYANDFDAKNKSHTHCFGLSRGVDGSFYFINWKDIMRTTPDRKTDYFSYGVRNCMGAGLGHWGGFLAGPQEGTFTPTSMVIEVHENEYYGHRGEPSTETISPPLCFVPRGIDNSTGGFVAADSEKWGPLNGHTIGLSYGYATHYLILRDDSTQRAQGAVVPLEGDFLSGIMRGAFSPVDGQLYVTGIDGWGDYAVRDGCFERIRYTGQPLRKPVGYQVHENGLRLDFSVALENSESIKPENFFVHQWDYEYSKAYGSPEYSKRQPDSLGHDVLSVRSVIRLNGGKSLFLEIPEIETVMQMHVRMHLLSEDGVAFKTDIFPTVVELGDAYQAEGLATPLAGKDKTMTLRVRAIKGENKLKTESGKLVEGERTIELNCSGALQFSSKLIEAKAGEALRLVFKNPDVMPHNVVLVKKGKLEHIGQLAFSMLNDPKAIDKHYTPDSPDVIGNTYIVQPGGEHILHFTAPEEAGDHHFVCTFPGHWMTMNGTFRVSN